MPFTFENKIHRAVYEKVSCFLDEKALTYDRYVDAPGYRIIYGSAVANVQINSISDDETLIVIACPVVLGANVNDPELLRYLLGKNIGSRFGGYAVTNGDISFVHSMIGTSCTREQLFVALSVVVVTADEEDDTIIAKWGGTHVVLSDGANDTKAPVVDAAERVVYKPKSSGIGDGKAFYFFFAFRLKHASDQAMRAAELAQIDDDIESLVSAGYTVIVEKEATKSDLLDALHGQGEGAEGLQPAGILWSGHGSEDGTLQTCDGGKVGPADIETARVPPSMRLLVLSSCYVGNRSRSWRKALGGKTLVVGWGRPVTISRAVAFLEPDDASDNDFDDLLRRYILTDTAIPEQAPDEDELAIAASITVSGTREDLAPRMARIAEMVGGTLTNNDTTLLVTVPLGDGKSQAVHTRVVLSTEAFLEGAPLLGAEADVGEMSAVVETSALLGASRGIGYAKVAGVKSDTDMPRMVIQGFLPLAQVRDQDLAAMIYQVAERADALAMRVFGMKTSS